MRVSPSLYRTRVIHSFVVGFLEIKIGLYFFANKVSLEQPYPFVTIYPTYLKIFTIIKRKLADPSREYLDRTL